MSKIDVQFTCPDCDETFTIDPEEILESEGICCPNCGCKLSEEELRYLKIAIDYMGNIKPN
ncbi:hypothetical protein Desca_1152 [Desulfotomaculum nigrificans CO-1-SRB]|uniref:Lysine biosynthesis protein LysW n=1 Tax=Desulfotomaculum nigrificans (strain DSM 14880 / VKM B-2319 / CO-1-SRB) TaxID=868595 RepID=F6B3I8_DESCC|nr:hypothetical protein [Desulfotomaculum nigrificans]AEF94017.1 hypothetical protein Desca_1152 [Desulfotomaculum nigrificans CO-1-SRB]